jgi:hypothetical protein
MVDIDLFRRATEACRDKGEVFQQSFESLFVVLQSIRVALVK